MSIASEITSMGENLKKDYQSIANLGADLTNVDKNIENIAELLDGVYDRLPKTEFEEGESVTLENTLKGKLDYDNGVVGIGQASQESTQGYNLLNLKDYTETINGVTITIRNGVITLNGASTNYTTRLISQEPTSQLNGDYNLNYEYVSGSVNGTSNINLYDGTTELATLYVNTTSRNQNVSFSNKVVSTRLYYHNNVVFNNYTIKPMLYSGNYDSSKTFEKYTGGQASPNPSYPQEIKYVRGKNRCDIDSSQIGYAWNLTTSSDRAICNIECIPNTTYTLSYASISGIEHMYINEKTSSTSTERISYSEIISTKTFITSSTTKCICIQFNKTNVTLADLQAIKLQIEKGSTSTPYLPYNTIEEVVSGKNLLDISKFENNYTLDSNGLPAYSSGQTRLTNTTPIIVEGLEKITLTYTGWGAGRSFIYSLLKADNTLVSRVASNLSGTTITIGEAKYLYICFYDGATLSNVTDAMLVEGSTGATYEPYITPKSYQLSLGDNKFYGIPNTDYRDELVYDVENDKVYKNEKIGELVLNGTENWVNSGQYGYPNVFFVENIFDNILTSSDRIMLSTHFKFGGALESSSLVEINKFYMWKTLPYRLILGIDYTQVSQLTNWLNSNNVSIYYQKVTPTQTEITDTTLVNQVKALYNAHSNNGTTIITSNGNLPMIIKVRGLKGE